MSSAWRLGLAYGVYFAVVMGLFTVVVDGRAPVVALPSSAFSGLVFGVLMGWWIGRQMREVTAGLVLTLEERVVAFKAADGGPLPDQRLLLEAARDIGRRRLLLEDRQPVLNLIVLGAVAVLTVVMALTVHWLWWSLVPLLVLGAWRSWHRRRRLENRLVELERILQTEEDSRFQV